MLCVTYNHIPRSRDSVLVAYARIEDRRLPAVRAYRRGGWLSSGSEEACIFEPLAILYFFATRSIQSEHSETRSFAWLVV